MIKRLRAVTAFSGVALLGTVSAAPAAAQPSSQTADEWAFNLTPYVWFIGIDGDVGFANTPTAELDMSFRDIYDSLDIAFLLAGDVRRGRLGVMADFNYLRLSEDAKTPGTLFDKAEVTQDAVIFNIAPFYRAVAYDQHTLDLFGGARVNYVNVELDLSPGILPGRTEEQDEIWVDPIVGMRGHINLFGGLALTGIADVGGFGIGSNSTWEVLGTIDYNFNDWASMHAGYRYLSTDYEDDGFVWDVDISGPMVGGTFRF